jgi:drug/metabolite transporter (DMT)-like permease
MSTRHLRSRTVGWGLVIAVVLVVAIVLVTWRASSPLFFLLYPILVLGVLALLAMAVLWAFRHF